MNGMFGSLENSFCALDRNAFGSGREAGRRWKIGGDSEKVEAG